ncbi:MAG: hypothetical protein GXO15_05460 [Crenarchaeota archaeon]|nr:hypothetical protein [Thermoproteota archaeon]
MYTKEWELRSLRDAGSLLRGFMAAAGAGVLLAGVLGLALAGVLDLAGRLYELAVLRALGFTDERIALLEAVGVAAAWLLSAPLALLVGYMLAGHMASLAGSAFPGLEPRGPLESLLASSWAAAPVLAFNAAVWALYLRRLETARLLAEPP